MCFRKRRAFTLIELLVVVAIISVLAALLMPALRSAVDQAHSIACMANLKQISLAYGMYADDYRSRYPAGQHLGANGGPNLTWHGFLNPYLDVSPNGYWAFATQRVYFCPAKEGRQMGWGSSSYGQVHFGGKNDWEAKYWKVNAFGGKTILTADTGTQSNGMDMQRIFAGGSPNTRHLNRANFIRWDLSVLNHDWPWWPGEINWWDRTIISAPKYNESNNLVSPASGFKAQWLQENW